VPTEPAATVDREPAHSRPALAEERADGQGAALVFERRSDPLESVFFDREVLHTAEETDEDLSVPTGDHLRYRLARWKEARVARSITFAILAVSLTGIGALLAYHKLIMPEPVSLASETISTGGTSGRALVRQLPGSMVSPSAEAIPGSTPLSAVDPPPEPTEPPPQTEESAADQPADVYDPEGTEEDSSLEAAVLETEACCAAAEKLLARLAEEPGNAETLVSLAGHYLEEGKNSEAERFALRAVEVDPSSSAGWIALGAARDARGDRTGAREAYRRCSDLGDGMYARECKNLLR
jgi:tetratricopeptide (TPR) repeat protein